VPDGYFIASANLFQRHSDQVAAFCAGHDIAQVAFYGGVFDAATGEVHTSEQWSEVDGVVSYYADAITDVLLVSPDTVCSELQPPPNTVEYEFCEMEAAMYRAIMHLSDFLATFGTSPDSAAAVSEIRDFLAAFTTALGDEQLQAQFTTMDADNCGYVTWDEVRRHAESIGFTEQQQYSQVTVFMFLDMSGDANGVLTREDWQAGLGKLSEWIGQFVRNFESLLDRDQNGDISVDELESALAGFCSV